MARAVSKSSGAHTTVHTGNAAPLLIFTLNSLRHIHGWILAKIYPDLDSISMLQNKLLTHFLFMSMFVKLSKSCFLLQDKEEKERLMVGKAAVEESDKELNSGGEEIIELQEMRVSPIPSLRNRHKQKYYKDPRGEELPNSLHTYFCSLTNLLPSHLVAPNHNLSSRNQEFKLQVQPN